VTGANEAIGREVAAAINKLSEIAKSHALPAGVNKVLERLRNPKTRNELVVYFNVRVEPVAGRLPKIKGKVALATNVMEYLMTKPAGNVLVQEYIFREVLKSEGVSNEKIEKLCQKFFGVKNLFGQALNEFKEGERKSIEPGPVSAEESVKTILEKEGVKAESVPAGLIELAAKNISMANAGILREGQVITIIINGKEYEIKGEEGKGLLELAIEKISNEEEKGELMAVAAKYGGKLPYEAGIKIVPSENGNVTFEFSSKASIEIRNGELYNPNVTRKFVEGENIISIHTHPSRMLNIKEMGRDVIAAIEIENICGRAVPEYVLQATEGGVIMSVLRRASAERFTLAEINGGIEHEIGALNINIRGSELLVEPETENKNVMTRTITLNIGNMLMEARVVIKQVGQVYEITINTYKPEEVKGRPEELFKDRFPHITSGLPPEGYVPYALAPGRHNLPAELGPPLTENINNEKSQMALIQCIKNMLKKGIMTGALVAAPHIDTLADKDGKPIPNTGFDVIARLSKNNRSLLRVAILVNGPEDTERAEKFIDWITHRKDIEINEGAKRTEKLIDNMIVGRDIEIIDISKRNGATVASCITAKENFKNVPYNNIGIGLVNTENNIDLIENEFKANRKNSANVLLLSSEVIGECEAQTVYVDVLNIIYAITAKGTSFLGVGINPDESKVSSMIKKLEEILGNSFVKIITKIGSEFTYWIDSINKTIVAV